MFASGSVDSEGKAAKRPAKDAAASRRMRRRLAARGGRRKYARRKHLVEPAIGWLKRVLGFRQFSVRGLAKVAGEFGLVCAALNIRRMRDRMEWVPAA